GLGAHHGERPRGARGGDLLDLGRTDLLQDVAHHAPPKRRVYRTNSSSLARAAPEARISSARPTPSSIEPTRLAVYSATPALKTTMSRAGPGLLSSTPSTTSRDSAASSTRRLRLLAIGRSKSSGCTSYSRPAPFFSSPTMVA